MSAVPPANPAPGTEARPSDLDRPRVVVLTGNPNCGKTTLFNALTGLRAKVGNYAGVTVERKEGRLRHIPQGLLVNVLDLPGTYSLSPRSIDEQIARDVLFHRLPDVPQPDLVIVVIDASNLERNLFFASQVIELGYPTVVALNMIDVAEANGHQIDAPALERILGIPVLPLVASTGRGVDALRTAIVQRLQGAQAPTPPPRFLQLPAPLEQAWRGLAAKLPARATPAGVTQIEALLLLTDARILLKETARYPESLHQHVAELRQSLDAAKLDWRSAAIEARYTWAGRSHSAVTTELLPPGESFSDRLDRIVTHRFWGGILFLGLMALLFQSIFTLAQWPMETLESLVNHLGRLVSNLLPPGDLNSLLVDGAIAGAGSVAVFLPQILLLFLFLGLLEDTGYMARAAFLMDRLMRKVGLHGRSFIPLLSSFACAIPGILATRTIDDSKDRLATILVAPLMTCSARLPVYALLIAACIPDQPVFGWFRLPGLTLLSMYLLGIVAALAMAWIFKRTLLRGEPPLLIMELPPYRRPQLRQVLLHMWERSRTFIQRAGTVILGASILLWFLATYPRDPDTTQKYRLQRNVVSQTATQYPETQTQVQSALQQQLAALDQQEASERLRNSFAGRLGRTLEPVIAPLGFDWQIGIGIVTSFAARELFVSTLSTVYNVGQYDPSDEGSQALAATLRAQKRPSGEPVFTARTALSLMVFYVFALQCVSTVAVVRRETNSWRWPLLQWLYMAALAWTFAFLTYQGLGWLGWS